MYILLLRLVICSQFIVLWGIIFSSVKGALDFSSFFFLMLFVFSTGNRSFIIKNNGVEMVEFQVKVKYDNSVNMHKI